MKLIRQGDVLLIATTAQPSVRAKVVLDNGRTILAYGEVTGHSHEVVTSRMPLPRTSRRDEGDAVPPMQLFEEPDGTRLLVVKAPCALQHQEHDPAILSPGVTYRVIRQCEWDAEQIRRVAD